jgi:hypothetical protein
MIGTIIGWHGAKIEEGGELIRVCLTRPCRPGVVMALREAGFRGPVENLERAMTPRAIFDAQAIVTAHYGPQLTNERKTG